MIANSTYSLPTILRTITRTKSSDNIIIRSDPLRRLSSGRTSSFSPSTLLNSSSTQSSIYSSNATSAASLLRPVFVSGAQNHGLIQSQATCYSSTASKKKDDSSEGGGITGWMNNRREKQEKEKYVEQMEKLSNMDRLTMKEYHGMLSENLKGFMMNISFLQTSEVKTAKALVEVVEKIMDVVGPEATADDLIEMDRLQRLKVAAAANKTTEEIAILVSQITNMDVMQKALRKRKMDGKKIPEDMEQMQAVIKRDALNVMSKSQKNMMKGRQENYARRMARQKTRR